MSNHVSVESFESIKSIWADLCDRAEFCTPFLLPAWMTSWWSAFGGQSQLKLWAIRQDETVIGIAPIQLAGDTASFIGQPNTCDYLDFIISPGKESEFFSLLLPELTQAGIQYLELQPVQDNSHVITTLAEIARDKGMQVSCQSDLVSLEIILPPTWEEYLGILNKKQRHEIKRKLRRLHEVGDVNFYLVNNKELTGQHLDLFLDLFRQSRDDKFSFMTPHMESFFREMSLSLAKTDVLKLGILELDSKPAAVVIGFEYQDMVYLYNSGYDPQFSSLSAGLLSKVMFIRDSIERGKKKFDLLSGAEEYKYRLGGKEIALHSCRIKLT